MDSPIKILQNYFAKLIFLIGIMIIIMTMGIWSLMYFDNYSFFDALWVSVYTVTSVGYSIDENLSTEGKIANMIFILSSVSVLVVTLSVASIDFMEGKFFKAYNYYKMMKSIGELENHVLLCGFGRNGHQAAKKLELYNMPYIILDTTEHTEEISEYKNAIFFHGDAIIDENLIKCGIDKASALIAALPKDADNLFVVLTARQLNKKLKIISRAAQNSSIAKLKMAGANNVVMPDQIGGQQMASLVVTPDIYEFFDSVRLESPDTSNLIEIPTNKLNKKYIGKTVGNLDQSLKHHCLLLGYKNLAGEYKMNPGKDFVIEADEFMIYFGQSQQISFLKNALLDSPKF